MIETVFKLEHDKKEVPGLKLEQDNHDRTAWSQARTRQSGNYRFQTRTG
jgi:hypothetical protein